MMTDLPLRTAHAMCPVETGAQDGLPTPVALPVEMKPPQVADAAGAISRQADNDSRHAAIFFIVSSLRWLGLCLWLRMGAEKIRRKYTTWSRGTALYWLTYRSGASTRGSLRDFALCVASFGVAQTAIRYPSSIVRTAAYSSGRWMSAFTSHQ